LLRHTAAGSDGAAHGLVQGVEEVPAVVLEREEAQTYRNLTWRFFSACVAIFIDTIIFIGIAVTITIVILV
jgi:hypothetical protein